MLIDALLTIGNAGFVGFSPETLFGKRLEDPVICVISARVSEFATVVATVRGRVIKLIPNLPIPPLAIALPRWGVQTKTTRLIRGFAWNVIARTTRLSLELREKILFATAPSFLSLSHMERVTVVTCA